MDTYERWKQFISSKPSFESALRFWDEESSITDKTVWKPTQEALAGSNISKALSDNDFSTYSSLLDWSLKEKAAFWDYSVNKIQLHFHTPPLTLLSQSPIDPEWFSGSVFNIVDSCFNQPDTKLALQVGKEDGSIDTLTYLELRQKTNAFCQWLKANNYNPGDRVTLFLPFSELAVVAYLALIKYGAIPILVPESFSVKELQNRMNIVDSTHVFYLPEYVYNSKLIKLIDKISKLPSQVTTVSIKEIGLEPSRDYESDYSNQYTSILFSSGTTNEPKAIPWTHLTAIKCAVDGYYHQDIRTSDNVTWTTGMGWMMAPWLIFATLINGATLSLFTGSAAHISYVEFLEKGNISILGVIPSLVKIWRSQRYMENRELTVRLFSSTGEPSNFTDYLYLMSLTDYTAPIIEYCGGTEIGGGYITGTIHQPCIPSTFTTPALGLGFCVKGVDDDWNSNKGAIYLTPPSIGLSETLLNRDHYKEYYADQPIGPNGEVLRKHGDAFQILTIPSEELPYYQCIGRPDDTMNLGGIKVSSIEIESVLNAHPEVDASAAISIREADDPEVLVVFIESKRKYPKEDLKKELNGVIRTRLNPLFRISDINYIVKIPRTASGKIMRRTLRDLYK